MPSWDAKLYLQFAAERTQPSRDLIARIEIEQPSRILDVGCGPGNSTEILRRRWPQAEIIGLDNSPAMIEVANAKYPHGHWILGDAANWNNKDGFDLVFSNAALQWVPDHEKLLPHLWKQVRPGGALAVQMPTHYDSPLHCLMLQIAEEPMWRQRMESARQAIKTERATFYYDLLQPLAARLDMWETQYFHIMENHEAILEWIRGTGLRPFLEALETDEQREHFQSLLLAGLRSEYSVCADGRVLFPFRRLFFVAYRLGR